LYAGVRQRSHIKISRKLIKGLWRIFSQKISAGIVWISSNSLWIYFWHIIPVTFFEKMGLNDVNFAVKWVLALAVAITMTALQNMVKKCFSKKETMV
jgi:uncharacterized membrane protein YcfT